MFYFNVYAHVQIVVLDNPCKWNFLKETPIQLKKKTTKNNLTPHTVRNCRN